MNYYERHIGDYLKDTVMLSPEEEGIYNRLIDYYYSSEAPLPVHNFQKSVHNSVDNSPIYKICRIKEAKYKKIIDEILLKFFHFRDGFWFHNRCDFEIKKYQSKLPQAEKKRENNKERQERARLRRRELFDILRAHGITPLWSSTTAELEALVTQNITR